MYQIDADVDQLIRVTGGNNGHPYKVLEEAIDGLW
jgi:hypothetical protein